MNPRFELAHLAHAELLTPNMEGTLWFFTELLGMRETARLGDSVYLRCYEDPYHHSLKVTAADAPGLANLGWRTTSADALERRAAALDKAGLGRGFTKGDLGLGRTFAFTSPDGHPMELVWDVEKFVAPPELRSPLRRVDGGCGGRLQIEAPRPVAGGNRVERIDRATRL